MRLSNLNVIGNGAFFVKVIPALRIRPCPVVEAGAEHIIFTVGLSRPRIVVGGNDARRDDKVAAVLHALCRALAADFVKITPRNEQFKSVFRSVGVFVGTRAVPRQPDVGHIGMVFRAVRRHPYIALRFGNGEGAVRVDGKSADRFIARHRDRGRHADVKLYAAVAVACADGVHIADLARLLFVGIGDVHAVFAVIGTHFDFCGTLRHFLNDIIVVIHALSVRGIDRTQNGTFQPLDAAVSGFIEHTVDLEPCVGCGELAIRTAVFKGIFGRSFALIVRGAARCKRRHRTGKSKRKADYRDPFDFHIDPLYFPRMRISEIPAMLCPSGFSTVMLTLLIFSSSANSANANAPTFTYVTVFLPSR